eukprot:TRINITY_DN19920_c0_g1_i1.p2 TRINITY_DN19920_c0_g1~~TRINITY_DN19920_c0_g1_i1.p2  ORF type:complete len:162 (-),score=51.78 TRINITY_DN19920_c0_g1_i1:114-599(-)
MLPPDASSSSSGSILCGNSASAVPSAANGGGRGRQGPERSACLQEGLQERDAELAAEQAAGGSTQQAKVRDGALDSLKGDPDANGRYFTAIARGLFTMEENVKDYVGRSVVTDAGDAGTVTAAFGKAGKCRVAFADGTSAAEGAKVWLLARSAEGDVPHVG